MRHKKISENNCRCKLQLQAQAPRKVNLLLPSWQRQRNRFTMRVTRDDTEEANTSGSVSSRFTKLKSLSIAVTRRVVDKIHLTLSQSRASIKASRWHWFPSRPEHSKYGTRKRSQAARIRSMPALPLSDHKSASKSSLAWSEIRFNWMENWFSFDFYASAIQQCAPRPATKFVSSVAIH